jgi:hypothetical protein
MYVKVIVRVVVIVLLHSQALVATSIATGTKGTTSVGLGNGSLITVVLDAP